MHFSKVTEEMWDAAPGYSKQKLRREKLKTIRSKSLRVLIGQRYYPSFVPFSFPLVAGVLAKILRAYWNRKFVPAEHIEHVLDKCLGCSKKQD